MKTKIGIISSLDIILNKGFCSKTLYKAYSELERIKSKITEEEYRKLKQTLVEIDPENPDAYLPEWYRKSPEAKAYLFFYNRKCFADYIKKLKVKYTVS